MRLVTSVQHSDACAERYKYRDDGALVEAENGSLGDRFKRTPWAASAASWRAGRRGICGAGFCAPGTPRNGSLPRLSTSAAQRWVELDRVLAACRYARRRTDGGR